MKTFPGRLNTRPISQFWCHFLIKDPAHRNVTNTMFMFYLPNVMTARSKEELWSNDSAIHIKKYGQYDEVVMTTSIDKQCVHKMWTDINEIPSLSRQAIYHHIWSNKKVNYCKIFLSFRWRKYFYKNYVHKHIVACPCINGKINLTFPQQLNCTSIISR